MQKRALASEIEHRNQLTRESAGVPLKQRPQSALLPSRTTTVGWTPTTPRPPPPAAAMNTAASFGGIQTVRPQSAPYSQQRSMATSSRPVSAVRCSQPQHLVRESTSTTGRQTSSDQHRPQGQPEFAKGSGPRHPEARPGSARMAAGGDRRTSRQVTVTSQPSGEHWRAYNSEPRADGALFNAACDSQKRIVKWIPPQKMGIEANFLGRLERSA